MSLRMIDVLTSVIVRSSCAMKGEFLAAEPGTLGGITAGINLLDWTTIRLVDCR